MLMMWLLGLAMAMEPFDWVVLNDTVMGGRSSASVEYVDSTTRVQGVVSLENNGGFASIRTQNVIDLSNNTTVEIELVGTDAPVQFVVWTGQGANLYYATPVQPNSGVQRIDFSQFESKSYGRVVSALPLDRRNRKKVSVGILIGDGFEGAFDLTLNQLSFVGEAKETSFTLDSQSAMRMAQVLQRAIQRGVPVYNSGNPSECAAIYQTALEDLLLLSGDSLPVELQEGIQRTLESASRMNDSDRAWAYRRQMDELLTAFQ